MMRKVKFIQGKTPRASSLVDAETGEVIRGVRRITMDFHVDFPSPQMSIDLNEFESECREMILLTKEEYKKLKRGGDGTQEPTKPA